MKPEILKILVVDDEANIRESLKEALTKWGFHAAAAKGGTEALEKLGRERFDIVITDLMMPDVDGLTLLGNIKDLYREILVIIITGYATIETAVRAINAGAYDYIAKPFTLDELMVVIRNASERLRLSTHNKALLDELKNAQAEITVLKSALSHTNAPDAGVQASQGVEPEGGGVRPSQEAQPDERRRPVKGK